MVPVGGSSHPRFAGVRKAFEALDDPGGAVAVVHAGEVVVDLYGGWRDTARSTPWTPDTLVHVFSVGKAVVAAALVRIFERRSLDDPVAKYWPEFAANGKGETTVRHVLTHTAGLPAFPQPVRDPGDWHGLCAMLAAAEPEFPAGTAVAEHAMTYGHLVGELIRRVDGRMPGEYLRTELPRLDLALGETPDEQARTADLEYTHPGWPERTAGPAGSYRRHVLDNPPGWLALDVLNSKTWRQAQVPAVGLHTTALSLARFYADLTGHEEIRTVHAKGTDRLLQRHVNWGLGVQVEETGEFGMGGIGGCDAFAHPAKGYAFGYVTRCLGGGNGGSVAEGGDHDRSERLVEALEECL